MKVVTKLIYVVPGTFKKKKKRQIVVFIHLKNTYILM